MPRTAHKNKASQSRALALGVASASAAFIIKELFPQALSPIVFGALFFLLLLKYNRRALPSFILFYIAFIILSNFLVYFPTIALSFLFLSFPFCYPTKRRWLMLDKTKNILYKNMLRGFLLGIAMFILIIPLSLLLVSLGVSDTYKVAETVKAAPSYIIFSSVSLGPLAEEIFFRGFLVPVLGILPSSLLFAAFHFAYGSYAQIILAFILALILAVAYQRSRSITVPVIAHIVFNLISLALILA